MAVEEIDSKVYEARYKLIAEDRKNVRVYLPEQIVEYLQLKKEGRLGFKLVKVKGKKYVIMAELVSEI